MEDDNFLAQYLIDNGFESHDAYVLIMLNGNANIARLINACIYVDGMVSSVKNIEFKTTKKSIIDNMLKANRYFKESILDELHEKASHIIEDEDEEEV